MTEGNDEDNKDSTPSTWEVTKQQRTLFISLCLMNFCLFALVPLVAPLFPSLADKRGLTTVEMGYVMGSSWLTMFVASPIFGIYINKIGVKRLMLIGVSAAGLSAILFGTLTFVHHRWGFFAMSLTFRCIEGLGICAFTVAAQTIAAQAWKSHIEMIMGVFLTLQGVAIIVSPLLAGILFEAGGFLLPFVITGCVVLIFIPINWYLLQDYKGSAKVERSSIKTLLLNFEVISLAAHICIVTSTFKFIEYFSSLFTRNQFNYGPVRFGIVISVASALFAGTAVLWAMLTKVIGGRFVMCMAAAISFITCTFIGPAPLFNITPNRWLSSFMLVFFGASLSGSLVPAIPVLLNIAKSRGMPDNISTYGMVSACYNSPYDIGSFLGPLLGGVFYNYTGYEWTASIFGLLTFFTATVIFIQELQFKQCCSNKQHEEETQRLLDKSKSTDRIPEPKDDNQDTALNNY